MHGVIPTCPGGISSQLSKTNLSLVDELELVFVVASCFRGLLSKHIKMPVNIFAALLNLSGRFNWGENGRTWTTKYIIRSCHIAL